MFAARNHVWQIARRFGILTLGLAVVALLMRGPLAALADESEPAVDIPKIDLAGRATFKSKLQAMSANDGETDLDAVVELWKKLRVAHERGEVDADTFAAALAQVEKQASEQDTDEEKRESKPPRNYAATDGGDKSTLDSLPDWTSEQLMAFAAAAIKHKKIYDAELDERANVLRKAARQIDAVAADLDAADFDEQADILSERARSMRYEARRVRAPQLPEASAHEHDLQSLQYNLHVLRTYLQLYRTEHDGRFPDALPDAEGRATLRQFTTTTNAKGEVGEGPEFPHGPYMLSIPLNPLTETKHAAVVIAIDDWPPHDVQPNAGWLYHPPSGRIAPNSSGHLLD